ncbi:hypothetical protein TNCV_4328331 [Trichonephila clavipes]|nr:hypothetical protein TNCV_4328331 [Trichonephila clavipes]
MLDQNGLKFIGENRQIKVYAGNKLIFKANLEQGLYYADQDIEPKYASSVEKAIKIEGKPNDLITWHERFGHANVDYILKTSRLDAAERQLGLKVKAIRSDVGGEFIASILTGFSVDGYGIDIVVVVSRTEHAVDEEDGEIDKLLEVVEQYLLQEVEILMAMQRTSLAGLALESATSSGLGRAPHCNAGPHPGTTWNYKTGGIIHQLIEQPGHAGLSRAPCTIWRPETQTQLFSGTLYMAASSKTPHLTSPKVLKSSKPAPSASFPGEQSVVSSYQ